jgi:Na+:H+ antiporter, NhaA family
MHQASSNPLAKGFATLREFSAFLLTGTVAALIWKNVSSEGYDHFAHAIHFAVNDVFMVLFFGIAMKEVMESFLPGGSLSSVQKASLPVISTMGGVLGPIAMFFLLKAVFSPSPDITIAWAVPTATDIAYSWLFAGLIFGKAHPAVTFLLVLAVLDDLIGMGIIAVFYTDDVRLAYLGLVVAASVLCEIMRRVGIKSFWPYLLVGTPLAWYGLHETGVHAALALVPVIPFMPHAKRDEGIFASTDGHTDTLNQFEHFFKPIVDVGLFFFGIANAGVLLNGDALLGSPTWIIFISLLVGKTVGIIAFTGVGTAIGLKMPDNMNYRHIAVMGAVAGIGFTVALFVTGVALTKDMELAKSTTGDMLKLGALLSFASGVVAMVMGKVFKIEKIHTAPAASKR